MVSRNDTQLATIESRIYKPVYNVKTDCYEDKCPYLPYQRNRIKYNCPCASNAFFETTGKYKSHIQSKTHKRWLEYTHPKNVEKDRENKRLNKELRILNKKLNVVNKRLKKSNEQKKNLREIINQLKKNKHDKKKKM